MCQVRGWVTAVTALVVTATFFALAALQVIHITLLD